MNARRSLRLDRARDTGSILPITLVITVVLAVVVVAMAEYAATTLRYGQVSEERADRYAAADGGLDSELQDLGRKSSACATALGNSGNYVYEFGDFVNGIKPQITCSIIGSEISAIDAWAVVMTGEGLPTGELLYVSGGGSSANALKTFTGPVFIADPSRMAFQATLSIKEGDLWYTDASCAQIVSSTQFVVPQQLSFTPQGRGTRCTQASWDELFRPRRPPEPTSEALDSLVAQSPTPPDEDGYGCTIWSPGRYTVAPDFQNGSFNYMRSGNYFFDNVGEIGTKGAWVLAGDPGTAGPSIVGTKPGDTADNNPCRYAWFDDSGTGGATFFMGGSSYLTISANSSLEIVGKRQGVTRVSLQALEDSHQSTIVAGSGAVRTIANTDSGNNKQLAMRGLVWAPNASFAFDNIANSTVAALQGGAVVAKLSAGAAANANNFLIEVDTQPGDTRLLVTSTATNRGTTTIRAVVQYRPTDGAYAVLSRRVVDLTPE